MSISSSCFSVEVDVASPLVAEPATQIALSSAPGLAEEAQRVEGPSDSPNPISISPAINKRVFVSHFLSTWNSRMFEFGAVLYLATIFPNTLLPLSIYALIRGLSAILFAPAVGRYIDTGNRLSVVRVSIVVQRVAVATSCAIFWFLAKADAMPSDLKIGALAVITLLACVEKLCSIMNLVSVEKDWIVIIVEKNEAALRGTLKSMATCSLKIMFCEADVNVDLSAQMRRIDLFCKLFGPLLIATIDGFSTEIAIIANFGMNAISVLIEYFAIASVGRPGASQKTELTSKQVYRIVPALQEPKNGTISARPEDSRPNGTPFVVQRVKARVAADVRDLRNYFLHRAALVSFAGAILYLTVLSFGGQMATYLLASGFNSFHVGVARNVSTIFEISATWLAPFIMSKIGPVRAGSWLINWQILYLAAAVSVFWTLEDQLLATIGLVVGTVLSRVGLRGFDLAAQVIVQEEVEAESRGSFSAIEAGWQNFFELCSFATTIVFRRPTQFQWPVLISGVATATAGALNAAFVRSRRGHLLHLPACVELKPKGKRPQEPESEREPLLRESPLEQHGEVEV